MTRNSPEPDWQSSLFSFFSPSRETPAAGLNFASFLGQRPCRLCLTLVDTAQFKKKTDTNDRQDRAAGLLSPDELKIFQSFSFPKRQREWLGGRLAVKFAVLLLQGERISAGRFSAISILPRSNGSPELFYPAAPDPLPCISLSHSNDYAVGMAAYATACGVDIQKITPQTKKVVSRFAEQDEIDLLAAGTPALKTMEQLSLLWSAKEALKKAFLGDQSVIFQGVTLQKMDINRLLSFQLQFPGSNTNPAEVKGALLDEYALAFTVNNPNHA
jgi:4'-phosphopantetheinyl transferase EntD